MPGICDSPKTVFYEMVNIEREFLGWNRDQIRDFAHNLLGKTDPNQFTPSDWMKLVYALRRCD